MGRLWTQVHEEFDAPIYPTGYVGGLSIFRNEPVGGGLGFNPGNPIEPGDHGIWSGLSVLNPYDVILLGNSFGFGGDYLLSVKVRLIGSARLDRLADEALHIGLSNPAGGMPAFAFGSDTPNWQLFMGGIGYVDSGYPLEDNVWYRLQVCRYSGAIFWIINGRPIRFQGLPGYVQKRMLGEVTNQSGVGPMFDDRRGPRLAPTGHHSTEIHMAPVQCPLSRMFVVYSAIRIPNLY